MRCVAGTFLGPQRAMVALVNVPFSTETCNCNIIAPLSEQSYAHPASMYWYPACVEIKQFPKANAYSCYFNVVISKKRVKNFCNNSQFPNFNKNPYIFSCHSHSHKVDPGMDRQSYEIEITVVQIVYHSLVSCRSLQCPNKDNLPGN